MLFSTHLYFPFFHRSIFNLEPRFISPSNHHITPVCEFRIYFDFLNHHIISDTQNAFLIQKVTFPGPNWGRYCSQLLYSSVLFKPAPWKFLFKPAPWKYNQRLIILINKYVFCTFRISFVLNRIICIRIFWSKAFRLFFCHFIMIIVPMIFFGSIWKKVLFFQFSLLLIFLQH